VKCYSDCCVLVFLDDADIDAWFSASMVGNLCLDPIGQFLLRRCEWEPDVLSQSRAVLNIITSGGDVFIYNRAFHSKHRAMGVSATARTTFSLSKTWASLAS
jgi:hypothetical protein